MYMIYDDVTGLPAGTFETEPSSGTWTVVPQSALDEEPACFWSPAQKGWFDQDTGYRYVGTEENFVITGDHKAIYMEQTEAFLKSEAVSQLFGESTTVHWKLYLMLETLAYQGDPSPVASNYLILNAYATWQGVTLADAFTWAKEQIFVGYGIAANGVGAAMKILDDIAAAANITETQAAFFDASDWETQVVDPLGGMPSLSEWPAPFLPSAGSGGGGSTNIDGGNAASVSTSSIDGGFA